MTERLRCWFLRDVVDAAQRASRGAARATLAERLPERLVAHLDPVTLGTSGAEDTVSLDDGEELLLAIDSALGDGSGRVLSEIGSELASHRLSRSGGFAATSDLIGVLVRARVTIFEHAFVGVSLHFDITSTDTGFDLELGIPGRPRAAKALRYLAVGVIRTCASMSRETGSADLKLFGATIGDRARLTARYPKRSVRPQEPAEPPRTHRRSSRSLRAVTGTHLREEVDRILSSAPPPTEQRQHEQTGARARTPKLTTPPTGTTSTRPPKRGR